MNRRQWLSRSTLGAGALGLPWLAAGRPGPAQPVADGKKLPALKITDVKTILTAPANIRLVVVKVLTNEPGLYGLGCATFTQRARVVETAIDKYLRPFLLGKDPLLKGLRIGVSTNHRVVTLAGTVPGETQRRAAEADGWCLFGVDRVVNLLDVRPPAGGP